jgi:flagellar biosynthesis anti-sigma factor FlgM
MKINDNSSLTTSKSQSSQLYETPKLDGGSSTAAARRPEVGDNVDLGSQASLLSQAQSAGAPESSANVQRLRALVQSGQYQVDHPSLSQSIVSGALNDY